MRILALIVSLMMVSPVFAGRRCFCAPAYVYPPAITEKVEVITRQIKMQPPATVELDAAVKQALQLQWEMLSSEIPVGTSPSTLRQFRFRQNWPEYVSSAIKQKNVQLQTETRVLTGVIYQNVVIQNGTVTLDVPQDVIQKLQR